MKSLIVVSAAVVMSLSASLQMTSAAERHHPVKWRHATVERRSPPADAYAAWPAPRPEPDGYSTMYSGGWSAPAGQ